MRLALLAVLACCLTLAACGDTIIDADKGQRLIKTEIEKVVGVSGVTITCPKDRKAKKGDSFTCEAKGADGTTQPITVTQKDDAGNVHFDAPLLHTREAETAMLPLVEGSKEGVKIDCPDLVVPVKGKTMVCDASATDGSTAKATVRFTGEAGKFTLVDVK